MTLTLEMTPEQQRMLEAEAQRRGLSPADYALARLMQTDGDEHIRLDERGVPWIVGTGTKVVEVVRNSLSGMTPDEIAADFSSLNLARIHAALRYYYDHQGEIDADIKRRREFEQQMRAAAGPSPVVARLRAEGKLPAGDEDLPAGRAA